MSLERSSVPDQRGFLACALLFIALFVIQPVIVQAQWTTPDASGNINNTNSGNVGVGKTAPAHKLDVLSSGTIIARFDTTAADHGQVLINAPTGFNPNLVLQHGGTSKWYIANYSTNDRLIFFSATQGEKVSILQNGKVGIGTTNPQDALHIFDSSGVGSLRVQGGNNVAGFVSVWDFGPMLILSNNRNPLNGNNFKTTAAGAQISVGADSPGDVAFYTTASGTVGTPTELVRMKANGRMGIGTATPGYQLDVQAGQINSSGGLCIAGDCKTAWSQVGGSQWTTVTGGAINYSAGNVGVGVTSPTTKLDVAGTVNASAFTVGGSALVSSQWATSGTTINYGTGNVGIATTSPTEKLHVTGNVKVTGNIDVGGNINAKYQDMAEWVDSPQELSAGTVVVLDAARSNQVIASTQSYDSRVAGVISLRPGVALGERGEGRVLVATTGRVKVKVDATNGPINIGDLLVTSDKEGVAMKSLPIEIGGARIHRPGTLIGKALEPLAQGTGEILVLLSLQ